MSIEINLATYDKQKEILNSLDSGEVSLMYLLAKTDSTANQSDVEALKEIPHIKNIANSEAAMRAVINSNLAWETLMSSDGALETLLKSKIATTVIGNSDKMLNYLLASPNCKTLQDYKVISGKFLPLKAYNDTPGIYKAYNGAWSDIGAKVGGWLLRNTDNPIATQIENVSRNRIYYYDLEA